MHRKVKPRVVIRLATWTYRSKMHKKVKPRMIESSIWHTCLKSNLSRSNPRNSNRKRIPNRRRLMKSRGKRHSHRPGKMKISVSLLKLVVDSTASSKNKWSWVRNLSAGGATSREMSMTTTGIWNTPTARRGKNIEPLQERWLITKLKI